MHGHTHQNNAHEVFGIPVWVRQGTGKTVASVTCLHRKKTCCLAVSYQIAVTGSRKQYRAPNPQQTGGDPELDPEVQDRAQGAKEHIASF
jgi:hypothetical protein